MAKTSKLISAVAALALGVVGASAAKATEITWNLSGSCASGYACNSTARTFLGSDGSTHVTAKGWGRTEYGAANNRFDDADLNQYSGGLGVTDQEESGSSPQHTVDNDGRFNIVSFFFDKTVDVVSALLIAYGDTDITFWVGNSEIMPDLTGMTVTDLDNLFGEHEQNNGSSYDRTALFSTSSQSTEGNFLIIGAKIDNEYGAATGNDYFKIKALAAMDVYTPPPGNDNPVPAPASLSIFGLGAFGVVVLRRRNARKNADGSRRAVSTKTLFAGLKALIARANNAFASANVSDDCFFLVRAR